MNKNNLKIRKNNIKNTNPLSKVQKILICKLFQLKENKLKYKNFAKKGNYSLPAVIIGTASSNEYYVKFPVSFENLKIIKNKKYICDCRLIKECNEKAYHQLLSKL